MRKKEMKKKTFHTVPNYANLYLSSKFKSILGNMLSLFFILTPKGHTEHKYIDLRLIQDFKLFFNCKH